MDSSSLCGQASDNPSHHRHRPTLKRTHACVMYVQVYRTDVLYILDWWSDVWFGVLYVLDGCVELDWCDVCTGLVYWTGI